LVLAQFLFVKVARPGDRRSDLLGCDKLALYYVSNVSNNHVLFARS